MTMTTSTKRLAGVTAAAAAILVIAWYLVVFSPQSHKLTLAHRTYAAAEVQASGLQTQVAQLNALVRQVPKDTQELAQFSTAVPDNPRLDDAVREIQQAATAAGVSLSSLSPAAPTAQSSSTSGTPAISVNMSVTGGYSQLMAFLSNLTKMPRTLVVTAVNISGTGNILSAQINSQIFYAGQPTP